MDKPKRIFRVLLTVLLFLSPLLASAEQPEQSSLLGEPSLTAELGYAGAVAYLRTTPLVVTVTGGSTGIDGMITFDLSRNTKQYDRYEYPVSVAAHSTQRIVIPLNLLMRQSQFTIRLVSAQETVAESIVKPARELGTNAVLVGALTNDQASLSYINMNAKPPSGSSDALWTVIALNEQNFPEDVASLNTFNIIVIDGFDVRTLPEAGQKALEDWIEQGGIAIVGGGASASINYPFFEKMTGIAPGALVEIEDLPNTLVNYAKTIASSASGISSDLLNGIPASNILINTALGDAAPLLSGEYPVLYETYIGNGAILTATFEIGSKALGQWNFMYTFWPNLIKSIERLSSIYWNRINKLEEKSYNYGSYDQLSDMARNREVPSDKNIVPVVLLLAFYLLIGGIGSYLILKKADKREFMWLTIPALAILCALSVRSLGARLQFDLPLGSTVTQILYDEKGDATLTIGCAVTSSSSKSIELSTDFNGMLEPYSFSSGSYYDYYDTAQSQTMPQELNYRYRLGDEPSVSVPNSEAWSVWGFRLENSDIETGHVTGSAWMEEDGLHAEIINDTGYALINGVFISNIGFNRMDDLSPGETGAAFLKQNDSTDNALSAADAQEEDADGGANEILDDDNAQEGEDPAETPEPTSSPALSYSTYGWSSLTALPVDGEMRSLNAASSYMDWDYLMAIAHPNATLDPQRGLTWAESNEEYNFIGSVYQTLSNTWYSGWSYDEPGMTLHYVALTEDLPAPTLYVDGKGVTQVRNSAYLDVSVVYEPIGRTGVVYYMPGMLKPWQVAGDLPDDPSTIDKNTLVATESTANYSGDSVMTFMFDLGEKMDIEIDYLVLTVTAYDTVPEMSFYNFETRSWDARPMLFERITGDEAGKYLSGGKLFVHLQPGENEGKLRDNGYYFIPNLTLKGRLS